MKKILSLIIVALFIVTMSINAFAVEVATFTTTISDHEVETGTETVTVSFTIAADKENWGTVGVMMPVVIPDGLTYVEDSLSATFAGTSLAISSAAVPESGLFAYDAEDDDSDLLVDGNSVTVTATFAITDPSVAATYEISIVGDKFDITDEENWDSYVNLYETNYVTTDKGVITVKAAAQDEKVPATGATVSAAGAEVKIGNLFYEGVVVFNNKIVLEAERNAKAVGWTLTAEGKSARDIEYTLPEIKSDGGEVQFAGVVFNVPENVTITATPYVVYGN